MRIFYKAPKWEEVYQINGSLSGIRFLLGLLFWIWGLGGFPLVIVDMLELMGKLKEGVGVGSSSFLAAIAVVWIGGMVFFGMGALGRRRRSAARRNRRFDRAQSLEDRMLREVGEGRFEQALEGDLSASTPLLQRSQGGEP